jgi:hypothetical protein
MEEKCNTEKPQKDPELTNLIVRFDETCASLNRAVNDLCYLRERIKTSGQEHNCELDTEPHNDDIASRFEHGLDNFESINEKLFSKIAELRTLI